MSKSNDVQRNALFYAYESYNILYEFLSIIQIPKFIINGVEYTESR